MPSTNVMLTILWLTWQFPGSNSVILQSINVAGHNVPEQSGDVDLVCETFDLQPSDNVSIYKTNSEGFSDNDEPVTGCTLEQCTISVEGRYNFTTNNSGVYIHIRKLDRAMDQAWWHCTLYGQKKSLELKIYTTPTTIETHFAEYGTHDLSRDKVTLVCRTSCIYPEANIEWNYLKTDNSQHKSPYITSTETEICDDWEKRQLVNLSIPINTTLPDNYDQPVKFRCSISVFPGLDNPLYSKYFDVIDFAVTVDSVTLFDDGRPILPMANITAFNEKKKTLECRPGTARPKPMIVWYMNSIVVQMSKTTSFSFIANPLDDKKTVRCRAYNLQTETSAVISYQGILSVIVRPDAPISLSIGTITPNSVTIDWTPGHDGGKNQTFHLQYKKSKDVDWTTETIDSPSAKSFVINKLSPGTLYEVQLYASNIIGNSSATQPKVFATQCTALNSSAPTWAWVVLSLFIFVTVVSVGLSIALCRVYCCHDTGKKNPRPNG